ncbi:serpin family protein [Nocardia crassostreae]|uniref:serpin family protein n=1 Tax=Nocardia crassostreae TaxID=53428 RepID=UPI0008306AAA|nr:serpin family protein [Nocardia crassostreae]
MDATTISAAVRASNELTARWCETLRADGNAVLSGAGLWPLLALLASAADDAAKSELTAAIGRPAESAQAEAVELLDIIDKADAASAALALWLRPGLTLADPTWAAGLPAGTVETLTGQARVDAWAAEHTRGLIERLPLQLSPADMLVLATALAVKTRWTTFFEPARHAVTGRWAGHRDWLTRVTTDLGAVSVLGDGAQAVTRVIVTGRDDIDVHLLLGAPESPPGAVLAHGTAALVGDVARSTAADLPVGASGHGFLVSAIDGATDTLRLTLPPFKIRAAHDLLATSSLFGLNAASDPSAGQFPALDKSLYVSSGAQDVIAEFSAEGFEAAAVTAFAMARAAFMRPPASTSRRLEVTLDRPFGFLAVHRPTGLVLVAGWLATPAR